MESQLKLSVLHQIQLKPSQNRSDHIGQRVRFLPTNIFQSCIFTELTTYSRCLDIEGEAPSIDRIRLICMGKGVLGPLTATVEENEVPVFLTHPTPVNVSVKPIIVAQAKSGNKSKSVARPTNGSDVTSDCCCVIC